MTIRPASLEDIPHGLDPGLRLVLEQIIYTIDLREGRVARDSNARFARQEDRVVTEVSYTARTQFNGVIPVDNTVPQNTEGAEMMVLTMTPKDVAHRLRVEFEVFGAPSGGVTGVVAALFQDAKPDAIYVSAITLPDGYAGTIVGRHEMAAGQVTPITFKLRVGVSANSFYSNGNSGGLWFGPTPAACRMRVIELPSP
jgi:hypothetical protein